MHFSLVNHLKSCVPGVSLDCVVFGYKESKLHVLLLRYRNSLAWALPGGFLPKDEEMDDIVSFILKDRTGCDNIFLEQFYTFSSLDRSWHSNKVSRNGFEHMKSYWKEGDKEFLEAWFSQRFISTAFFALINCNDVVPIPDALSDACEWVPLDALPDLILDHRAMIDKALQHMRIRINYLPLGKELLGEKFTLKELQVLYEIILGRKLDRGNFQRKINKLNFLTKGDKLMTGAQNKAPYLYSINHEVYDELIEKGIGFN